MKANRCIHILFIFCMSLLLFLQTRGQGFIGQQDIINFSKDDYAAGAQNWAVRQDKMGRIYIANNEGLLVYNGTNWQIFPVPNNTILRSIEFGKDGKLYAGAQNELGYFAPDKAGRLVYTSLKDLLPESEKNFSDIWEIVSYGNDIFFRTTYKIFRLSDNKIIIHPPISTWLSLRKSQNTLIAHDEKAGLLTYKNGTWENLVPREALPSNFFMTDIVSWNGDTSLFSTPQNGLFLLYQRTIKPFTLKGNSIDPYQHFTSITPVDDNNFLVGTYSNGVYHINKQGLVMENISTKTGLQNNTIRRLFTDVAGNIWLGLDNGLSFIPYNNAVKHINPPAFNNGGGYAITTYKNNLFFALSTGLQRLPLQQTTDLSSLPDNLQQLLGGQTWNLSLVNNLLLAGRDDGFWDVSGSAPAHISSATGFWTFKQLPDTAQKIFAAGNYAGVQLFEDNNGAFTDKGQVEKFAESARYLETDGNDIWVSHPYRGVFKIDIATHAISMFTEKEGLPSALNNHVFKIKGKIVIATVKGIYTYNAKTGKMEPADEFKKVFGERSLRYLKEDPDGNIWFVQDKMLGVADYSQPTPAIIYISELRNKILSGFENIYPVNNQNIFIGAEKGFYHINYEKYKYNIRPFKSYISLVKIFSGYDSVLYGGYSGFLNENSGKINTVSVPYQWNSFHFSYSTSLFEEKSNVEYSYLLEGFDKEWSSWYKKPEKDYTNLPAGSYRFRVKARSNFSNESEESSFSFSIAPPWYKTVWAYLLYALLFASLFYWMMKYQKKRYQKKHEQEQKQMAYQHQLELEKTDKEVMLLKNEKLEAEITHKNAELASTAMNLVQKKEFILKVREELAHLQKGGKNAVEIAELKKIMRILSDEEKMNEEWEQFSIHFNSVHGDFLNILKKKYPELKPHELKLCAYLRMNLSSKEIAQLMGISVRGVEISRYRLRKKLQLPTEVNLFQFLFDAQKEG